MEQLETMPTAYHRDRWAIFVLDSSVQFTATPHPGRGVGAAICVAPNAATARHALRLLLLEEPNLGQTFLLIPIGSLDAAKRTLLKREYESIQSLAMRSAAGDISIDGEHLRTVIHLHGLVTDRVHAIWDEGSLCELPASVSERRLTWTFAHNSVAMIRGCFETMDFVQDLANTADAERSRIAEASSDSDDYWEQIQTDEDYLEVLHALSAQAFFLSEKLAHIVARLRGVGVSTALRPSDANLDIVPCEGPIEDFEWVRDGLETALAELAWHTGPLPPVTHAPATARSDATSPESSASNYPVQFELPNYLHVDGQRFVCALATNRATVLKALIASGGSISAAAFGKNGAYCLWPNRTYPDGDSKEASARRKALEKSLSTTLSRLNEDLRNLRLPRALTARLVKGAIILEIA